MSSYKNLLKPHYTISDIQLDVGDHEFGKALLLHVGGAVSDIKTTQLFYEARVMGTHIYEVSIGVNDFSKGDCTCYVAQKDQLCKHMIALAIAVVHKYSPESVTPLDHPVDQAVCSGDIRDITDTEIVQVKKEIQEAMKYIKAYNSPSSTWFRYQDSLTKGSRKMLLAFSKIPICEKSALLCIQTLVKIDKKLLNGGVDDSDGTIGELMSQLVELLNMFVDDNTDLKNYILKKLPEGEVFDWQTGFMPFSKILK